ncbi:MAG: hypothetical protein ACRD2D_02865 [Terriglobales bacterium]
MPSVAHRLGILLLDSVPTIILFVLLHFYLRSVLYRPLRRVLGERSGLIEGKQEKARQAAAMAEQKLSGYEEAVRQQRLKNYRHIEAQRQQALQESQTALAAARQQSAKAMVEARQQLAAETTEAHRHLEGASDALAAKIMEQVLRGIRHNSSGKAMAEPGARA